MRLWKQSQQEAGLPLAYRDFRDKKELNAALRFAQHGICCYCQKRIDHYQKPKERGAHNEHLVPENGRHGVFAKQMDYDNLYACCIESQGMETSKTHCGEHKKDGVVYPFVQKENCRKFFRYNVLGEIIPNGEYNKWDDYKVHRNLLEGMVRMAADAIDTLNLNCNSLKSERREALDSLMTCVMGMDAKAIKNKMMEFECRHLYPEFIDMLLYFLERKIK